MSARGRRFAAIDAAVVGVALAVYVVHALAFGGWIVDDAGISFAYARSLAGGHGLVSQPGAEAVEGYSNPLWVLVLAAAQVVAPFDPVVVPKVLAAACVAAAFALFHVAWRDLAGGRRSVSLAALLCTAASTPFVAWTASGLENALLAAEIAALLALAVRPVRPAGRRGPAAFALVALAIALTRPDGVVYAAFPPLVAVLRGRAERRPASAVADDLFVYAGLFGVGAAALLAARIAYFHDVVPNPYHAKVGWSPPSLLLPGALDGLVRAATGGAGAWALAALAAATALLLRAGRFAWPHAASSLLLAASVAVYLALPDDWFGEYRYATAFFPLFHGHALVTARALVAALAERAPAARLAWPAVAAASVVLVAADGAERTRRFAAKPPLPFARVAAEARARDALADRLGLAEASALVPDLGGTLWVSRLRIFDLAMLCDRTIARTLGRDPAAFHDYVFERVRPTFIHAHDYWTALARFDDDPRFRRDYAPLREWEGDAWVHEGGRRRMLRSGDWVRKDALEAARARGGGAGATAPAPGTKTGEP